MPRLLVADAPGVVAGPTASPDAFGASTARAMQQTGGVAQALGQVLSEYGESQSRAASVRYEQELAAEADRISLDPEIESRGAKFEAAQRKIYGKYRPGFGFRQTYDQRTEASTLSLKTRLDGQTMRDGIAEARRNTTLEVTHKMLSAAVSDSDEEAGALFNEAQLALADSSLYMTESERAIALQNSITTGIRAMADTNPKRALRFIDRLGTMVSPEALSVYRGEAMANIRQAAAAEASAADRERRLRIQAETDASKDAEERLLELERAGTLTLEDVKRESGLSPAAYARMKRLATGGGSKTDNLNPQRYVDLEMAADKGEDIVEAANTAYINGEITESQRNNVVNASRGERFDAEIAYINESLNPGSFSSDRRMRQKRADAVAAMRIWKRENGNASATESHAKAAEIIRAAVVKLPKLTFMDKRVESQADVDKMAADIDAQLKNGIIGREMANELSMRLMQISLELDARASALGADGGE